MLILGLESSAKTASCALSADGTQIALYTQNCGLTHSTTLLPMVEDMLRNCGRDRRELTHIAVAAGPGSFTGVRIGCAAAKGLSFALEIPCRPVSTLLAIAHSCVHVRESEVVSCEMDARRGQLYNALFRRCGAEFERLTPDRAIARESLELELARLDVTVHRAELATAWGVILAAEHAPDAEPIPTYLRPSQAERELAERQRG